MPNCTCTIFSQSRCCCATEEQHEEDLAYIDDLHPNYQFPPSDPNSTDEYDVYQARLKVLAGLQPKTVELIKIANALFSTN
jgi:hypothetical protein